MSRRNRILIFQPAFILTAALMVWAASGSTSFGQLRGLKVPSLPKGIVKPSKPASPEVKPSRGDSPEVQVLSMISPDSAPPGGHGQLVLTGQNFKDGSPLTFDCKGARFRADSIKVESATKAVAQITVPVTAEEGPCSTSMRSAKEGPFQISNSASMPVAVSAILLGEGDMQFMEMMMKMQQAMAPGFGSQGAQGHIEIAAGAIKYVQGDKATFTEPIPGVKSMAEMKQGGQPIGIFRIIFNDGKIYNFMGGQQGKDAHEVFTYLQKRLGK